jgi:hypothetical protein
MTTIVINDGKSTPVARTFTATYKTGNRVMFSERDVATTLAGENQVILTLDRRNDRPTTKVNIRLNYPIEHQVDGVTVVDDVARSSTDVIIPNSMLAADRDDFAAMLANLLADPAVADQIRDGVPVVL